MDDVFGRCYVLSPLMFMDDVMYNYCM